jgi:hypothetical protein
MRFIALLSLCVLALACVACGDYANSVRKEIKLPSSNGPNPANLPDPNFVPKPDAPAGYPAAASSVVIDEVMLTPAGAQWVELFNYTGFATDIGGWTLSNGTSSFTFPFGFMVGAGDRVIVHLGAAGTDTPAEQFAPHFSALDEVEGSLALLRAGAEVMHFVQWGGPDFSYEFAAVQAGVWEAGDYNNTPAAGLSMQYDGSANNSSAWRADNPTPGN